MKGNLYDFLKSRFPEDLSKSCFIESHGQVTTYSELDQMAVGFSIWLQSLGVQKGDRVLVQVEKSIQCIGLYLGCLIRGAVYLPLNPAYTMDEVGYFLEDAEPRVAVILPEMKASLESNGRPIPEYVFSSQFIQNDVVPLIRNHGLNHQSQPMEIVQGNDLAAIVYTSGTTGRSKGAMLTHANLISNAMDLVELWDFRSEDVLIHSLPIYHVHGLFVGIHCALAKGLSIYFVSKFKVDTILDLLPHGTILMGVPTFYTRLLDDQRINKDACKNFRLFISGSAPLLESTSDLFFERTGHRVLERYGMSEAGIITSNPLNGERLAGSVGFLLPSIKGRVVADDGEVVQPGTPGILEIKGPNVFQGYWKKPDKTRQEFRHDGYFITGDIATMNPDGRITLVGRARDMIISGGLNVYPKEVEGAIDAVPEVNESAVVGVSHPDLGEGVIAVVVSLVSDKASLETKVYESLSHRLAKYKWPKKIFFWDDLPRNTMGKVQKNKIRSYFESVF